MKFLKVTIETTTDASDLIVDMLSEYGIEGAEIQDNIQLSEADKARMFIDILPELPPDDGVAYVSFYLDRSEGEEKLNETVANVEEGIRETADFVDVGTGKITFLDIDEDDFKDNWKEFFHPFKVNCDIAVRPTWEEMPEDMKAKYVLTLDPGSAFGTGEHETTKLCMINLEKYMVPDDTVLDIGCGSGILSILASKMGAKRVTGTDIDENAVNISAENTESNGIETVRCDHPSDITEKTVGQCTYSFSNVFDASVREGLKNANGGKFDLVVANILADVIIPITGFVKDILREDGIFISSGIYRDRIDEVKKACLQNKLEIVEILTMGDWSSFVCRNI